MELGARDGVDRAKGFVEEHELGRGGEGAHEAHALLLTTGELGGVTVAEVTRLQVHELEQLIHAGVDAVAVPFEYLGHAGDVVGDGHVREQPGLLDHVPDPATQLDGVDLRDVPSVHHDGAGIRVMQAVDELDERRLSAARCAEHAHELAGLDGEAHVVEGRRRRAGKTLRDVNEFDCGGHAPSLAARFDALSRLVGLEATKWSRRSPSRRPRTPPCRCRRAH